MYLIKLLLKLFLYLNAALFFFWLAFRSYFWILSAEPVALRSDDETRSTVHWLQQDNALRFNFSADRTYAIRVLSNAIFSEKNQFEEPVHYAIEYTLFDNKSMPLSTQIYHHASKLALDNEAKQVKQIIENRDTLAVSSGQSFFISSEQLTKASAISLRLIPENRQLRGVVIRLHAKTPVSLNDANRAWLRQSTDWRERMTNYHTIGNNAVSNQEILNAVNFEWQKLAPQGIPGIDFNSDTLYETLPYYVQSYDFNTEQQNLDSFYTDNRLSASFRNYQSQDLYFHKEQSNSTLFVTWYDIKELRAPTQLNVIATETNDIYTIPNVEPGLIVIQSAQPSLTRWFTEDDAQFNALHSYLYELNTQYSAEYEVSELSDIKFEFRGSNGALVDIELLNNEAVVEQYQVMLEGVASGYDRIINEVTVRQPVSEPEAFFLRLPKAINRIKVSSQQQVLAKLQARQTTFNYQNVICEQICQPKIDNFFNIGAWFSQKAVNDFTFTEQQRIINVRLFEPPPELPKEKMTSYLSRDLINVLPLSNTFLVNSPNKYFVDFYQNKAPSEHQFSQVQSIEQILQVKNNNHLRDKRLIELKTYPPFYKEQPLIDINHEQLLALNLTEHAFFINDGKKRLWQKQRSYFLNAGQDLTLSYTNKPDSVVIKAFKTSNFTNDIVLNTRIKGLFTKGISTEYTIPNKRFSLMRTNLTETFALHPAINNVATYNTVSLAINNDIKSLHSITLSTNQDVWISVLDEFPQTSKKVKWRQYETD